MSAEPVEVEEDRSAYAGVLRFYELAKHQEWMVRDVAWGQIPPVPEGKGSPERQARRRDVCAAPSKWCFKIRMAALIPSGPWSG